MTAMIEAYYDFRSPYAYFANCRARSGPFALPTGVEWVWRPASIDVLLNLQAGRDAWATYTDPLSPPKRAHLVADVRRNAAFYGIALRPPQPPRQNSVPALCVAASLDAGERSFRNAVFDALWQEQRDIFDPRVLEDCLAVAGQNKNLVDRAFSREARHLLAADTERAYAAGVFGVPTFVVNDEIFFGNDRLELLAWRLKQGSDRGSRSH